jgi:uncharacterized OsmC-like protein
VPVALTHRRARADTRAVAARTYTVEASPTDVFGRVEVRARDHTLVIDGPVENGCPGEEITPAEAFLAGVASCGVELMQVIARERGMPIPRARASVRGVIDAERQPRADVTLFSEVRVSFVLDGVDEVQAEELVESFKGR